MMWGWVTAPTFVFCVPPNGFAVRALGAKIVLAASTSLLIGVGVAWQTGNVGQRRSDLAGKAIRSAKPVAATGTAAVVVVTTAVPAAVTTLGSTSTNSEVTSTTIAGKDLSVPERIMIPALNVNAPIVSVGLKADKSMEIPGAAEAGWYRLGAQPGDATGSAVIAGHVDHANLPGVFLELRRLNVNDEVAITDTAGRLHGYRVTERYQVDKAALPTSELFRRDGPPVLTLITCGGNFDTKNRSYDDNIVIRATPL
jgi:LPXTG-site transpeptidase (sortase) family protein